nr:PREDICTED: uncharacterized protein LOC100551533 isoform X2 [Anolis carolinensis]|eukprot:XP_008105907.1 PREDICTED: uncharacterized protein LOC100551533 isoform X2 [Anolis carolinensis]
MAKPDLLLSTQCKKMFKMDVHLFLLLPCLSLILTSIDGQVCSDIIRATGDIGSTVLIPLGIQNISQYSVTNQRNCTYSTNISMGCCSDCDGRICLRKKVLEITNLTENDEGKYTLWSENDSQTFLLRVCELPLVVHIRCLPDGGADLSCEASGQANDSTYWTLNGSRMNDVDACQKDGGKRIILGKGVHGKLVCHRRNSCSSSSIVLSCNEGSDGSLFRPEDLLQNPLFLYILAGCVGGALLLAVLASVITCCCMKSKHHFIPVPAEDEKDEGITLAAISSEGQKSPPNGEHCEAAGAPGDNTANPGTETGEGFKQESKMDLNPTTGAKVESEPKTDEKAEMETEFREVLVDSAALEVIEDCFPDPTNA